MSVYRSRDSADCVKTLVERDVIQLVQIAENRNFAEFRNTSEHIKPQMLIAVFERGKKCLIQSAIRLFLFGIHGHIF